MLFLDGVYTTTRWDKSWFHRTNAPDQRELVELVHTISQRVAGFLEREGILERDEGNSYLNLAEGLEDPMQYVVAGRVILVIGLLGVGAQQADDPPQFIEDPLLGLSNRPISGQDVF
jgi:hypothetical protein